MRAAGRLIAIFLFVVMTAGTSHGIGIADIVDMGVIAPADIASNIIGGGRLVPNSTTFNGAAANPPAPFAAGTFTNGLVDGIGIQAGAIITTGDVLNAVGPNADQLGTDNAQAGDAALNALVGPGLVTNDASVLEFDFITPKSNVTFEYVFASEEYPPLTLPTNFNDVMAIFVAPSGSPLVNVAFVPGTASPISINTLNGTTPSLFNNNPVNAPPFLTQYNGFSKVLRTTVRITPNVQHHVKIAIADGGAVATPDFSVDSAVFMNSAMFNVSNIGTFQGGVWNRDVNGDRTFFVPGDSSMPFGRAGDIPVTGDWNGDGTTDMGVFRAGRWILDSNGNGLFESGIDAVFAFGRAGDIPVTGDWNGDGITDVGVYRAGRFILDSNGNRVFNPGVDAAFTFGLPGDKAVTGDWNNDGITEVGVFRAPGRFILDSNGNRVFNPGVDRATNFGLATDTPVVGHWTGDDDPSKIGVFRNGTWEFDIDGDGLFNPAVDASATFGAGGSMPVTGSW